MYARRLFWSLMRLFLFVFAAMLFSSSIFAQQSEEEILAAADARIEQHRKGDMIVSVVDSAGSPLAGAEVTIEQTRHAFLFGCNIFQWGRLSEEKDKVYCGRFQGLFNFATLAFYWWDYERVQGKPDHARSERIARWCAERGIKTKGHPLAWNFQDPPWAPDDLQELQRMQMARIDDCVTRLAGLVDCWDVVNEATDFERDFIVKQAPKTSGMWRQAGRMEFTRECFSRARKANPQATLLINDYRLDPPYEKVIEQLVNDKGERLYDVVGIQSHMFNDPWTNRTIWDVCERFSRFGVPLHFTEATICSGRSPSDAASDAPWPTTPEGEAEQARQVVRFYTMLFSHPAVEAITWWNLSDDGPGCWSASGLLRQDLTPKPTYEELIKLVKTKWWTKVTVKADENGNASCRGFIGDYDVTVTADGHKAVKKHFTISKGAENHCKIIIE